MLDLGTDVMALVSDHELGYQWTHFACRGNGVSTLALLLDAGAPINGRTTAKCTPLHIAADYGSTGCVALLIARGGDALDPDARADTGETALRRAAFPGHVDIVRLLLEAGADPTIQHNYRDTPLDVALSYGPKASIDLLQAAIPDPKRSRLLLKARTLLDAGVAVPKAHADARNKDLPVHEHTRAVLAAAPPCLKPFVAEGRELLRMTVNGHADEQLVAYLKYALGLVGAGA